MVPHKAIERGQVFRNANYFLFNFNFVYLESFDSNRKFAKSLPIQG